MVKINIRIVIIIYKTFLSGKRTKEYRFKVNIWCHFCFVLIKLCLNNWKMVNQRTLLFPWPQLNDTEDKQFYLLHVTVLPLSRALFGIAVWLAVLFFFLSLWARSITISFSNSSLSVKISFTFCSQLSQVSAFFSATPSIRRLFLLERCSRSVSFFFLFRLDLSGNHIFHQLSLLSY